MRAEVRVITLITIDYTDGADYGKHTSATSSTEKPAHDDAAIKQQGMKSIKPGQHEVPSQEDHHQQELAVISAINVINRNQCNQLHVLEPSLDMRDPLLDEGNQNTETMPDEGSPPRNRCPYHPRARMVHFDPAGQAWCDRQGCWDCFRLMKIGETLKYRRLTERGGKLLIEESLEAWVTYARTQRAFLVIWAIQEALALWRALGVQEPELSDEVKRLMETPEVPP